MTDASTDAAPAEPANRGRRWVWPGGLSARLLLLTGLFAVAAGLLILIPSLAAYQDARSPRAPGATTEVVEDLYEEP